jgi:23S rRNA (pseudouridine1915-N3)-methyltransferase
VIGVKSFARSGTILKLILASVSSRKSRSKSPAAETLFSDFLTRATRYIPSESQIFETEAALLAAAERRPNQPAAAVILCDSTGELVTSEQFAEHIRRLRDSATQRVLFAIGPADGWSPAALARADRVVSFGRITLPHELARVVLAEQMYRALAILAGHPYHSGH